MPWQIIVFIRVIIGHIVAPVLYKKATQTKSDLEKLIWWQFLFCLTLSVGYGLIFGFTFKSEILLVAIIGFFNSFGCYCQWQAVKINLAKASLFTQADDIIAVLLGYLILHETKYLNTALGFGVIGCFLAASILISAKFSENMRLIKYIGIYSVIWGVASFLDRYFALQSIPFSEFLIGWYGGSFIGISFFLLREGRLVVKAPKNEIALVAGLSIFVWLSKLLGYWGANLVPITIFQPIYLVTEAIFPTLTGLHIFHEYKTLEFKEKLAIALGLASIIAITVSYY